MSTVLSGEAPHNVNNHEAVTAQGILISLALAGANSGSNDFVYCNDHITFCLGSEHAATITAPDTFIWPSPCFVVGLCHYGN